MPHMNEPITPDEQERAAWGRFFEPTFHTDEQDEDEEVWDAGEDR